VKPLDLLLFLNVLLADDVDRRKLTAPDGEDTLVHEIAVEDLDLNVRLRKFRPREVTPIDGQGNISERGRCPVLKVTENATQQSLSGPIPPVDKVVSAKLG